MTLTSTAHQAFFLYKFTGKGATLLLRIELILFIRLVFRLKNMLTVKLQALPNQCSDHPDGVATSVSKGRATNVIYSGFL